MTPKETDEMLSFLCDVFRKNNFIEAEQFARYDVKRGLRNADGTGVMAGLTKICNVHGYVINEGEKKPAEGELTYRGININDLVDDCVSNQRFGYEEVVWLLLFGVLPTADQLAAFRTLLSERRELPPYFAENMIIKAPSPNVMNKLQRSVLALYSYDDAPEDLSLENVLRQSIDLIARMPMIMSYAYQVKRRQYDNQSMFFHPYKEGLSTSETILRTIRDDCNFTASEARLLDICLMLHAEHGGGNNSTFAARVLSSSGTDTFSAIAAAIGALKGPRHGGANIKVMEMLDTIKANVRDVKDDDEIRAFLQKILDKQAGDGLGLIYGMGHAIYTQSDPRAVILKENARALAYENGFGDDFGLLEAVERLTPELLVNQKGPNTYVCANVDLYSGLVYRALGVSPDLFTPLFAVARVAGWSAHRIEELFTGGRLIRPAYKAVEPKQPFVPLSLR